jgi:hypothetical protein
VNDVMSTDVVRTVVATLRINGAMPFVESKFVGCVDPFVEMDLSKDGTFINASSYSNIKALMVAEIGDWMGVRWKRSNFIPIIALYSPGTAPSATDVNTPNGGNTNFGAGTTTLAVVTRLDPVSGFETFVSAATGVTNAQSFAVLVTIAAADPTGLYNVYVSLQAGTVATLQQQIVHVAGTANTAKFVPASTQLNAGYFVVQATGPVAPPAPPATNINIHLSYVFGKEAFGVTELGGLQTFLTPPVPSDSDPAVQRRKASWKQIFKAVIKNTAFFTRVESASAFN